MASNNTFLDLVHSSRRKHRNSAIAVALRRRGTHKKRSGISSPVNFRQGHRKSETSARKLAAGLWELRFVELFWNDGVDSSISKLETYMPCLKCSKEEATKRNPALDVASNRKFRQDRKLVGDRDCVITVLLEELLQAQRTIKKLKAAHKYSKEKVKRFLQKLEEQKDFRKRREIKKIEAMLDDSKDKLAREKRSRERMEALNTKLAHELALANQSAKQFMTNYEKEKKERELTEEVCHELAVEIGEDKTKLEELLRDYMKIVEEVEEERKMMQMAELWREERVQMKLVDAKLILEDKYNKMVQLIAYLQMFLRSKGAEVDTKELEATQLIQEAVESVDIHRIVELSFDFSKSDDVFPVHEELRKDNAGERMITLNSHHTLPGPSSTVHIESFDEEGLNENSVLHLPSPSSDYNNGLELGNSSETVGYIGDQKFSSAPQRGDTYHHQEKNISGSEAECGQKAGLEPHNTGVIVNRVCSISVGKSKWKGFPTSTTQLRLCPNDGTKISKTKSSRHRRPGDGRSKQKECNWRLSTGSISSLCKGSVEGSFKHSELLGQGNSGDNMNPHIARGMKGCIEWPRGIPKTNSKVIPLEGRVQSQKSQLQHILKSKANN